MSNIDPLLSDLEVANTLRVSVALVRRWRLKHVGPPYRKIGGTLVRYDLAELRAWVAACSGGGQHQGATGRDAAAD
jgi:predicted DNA-binding transcriptional regulator AlpA